MPEFLAALEQEILLCEKPRGFPIETLYFGGGTPSLLTTGDLAGIFQILNRFFEFSDDVEITLEANPGSLNFQKLQELKALGVNRLSLGLQSLSDEKLSFLGRSHNVRLGKDMFEMARKAGFDNISLDFIYGLPGESLSSWTKELKEIAELRPEHLSLYMLGIEEETPLGQDLKQGALAAPDERVVAKLFRTTLDLAGALGYPWYEVSSFAQNEKYRSRHNQRYWTGLPWLSFGPGAHSFLHSRRFSNIANLDRYLEILLEEKRLPRDMDEKITPEKTRIEALYLGFRTKKGIQIPEFDKKLNTSFLKDYEKLIRRYEKKGFLVCGEGACRLTEEGLLFLDAVTRDFVVNF